MRHDRSTGVEWTNATWNPVTGCDEVSPGCAHCYAETFAERFRGVVNHRPNGRRIAALGGTGAQNNLGAVGIDSNERREQSTDALEGAIAAGAFAARRLEVRRLAGPARA